MGGVRIQDRIHERISRQYVFRGEQFVEVMRGDVPLPGDSVSAHFGEPGFRLTFDHPVHGPEDLPPGLLDALDEALGDFHRVRESGVLTDPDEVGLDVDDLETIEWVMGPDFVGGNLVISLDTDDAGLYGRALDRTIMLLVAALEPFGSVEIGAATESDLTDAREAAAAGD